MNLKMSDFLFEEKSIQELEGGNESEGRLELRAELSDDHIKGGPELLLADVHRVAEEIASHIFALSSNAVNNAKVRHATKGKSKEDLTPEEIEAIKKADEILDLPLGVIDSDLLKDLFKKNYSVGYAGKIEGRAHLNPVQLKRDAKQVAGGTPIDLEESKKMQMVFMFLSNENSEIVQCKGKAIVFAIPALGANCIKGLDYYSELYPDVTEETPILYHIPKAAFFLLPFDEFDDFQTNKLQTIIRCLRKEKTEEQVEQEESGETNESFVYQRGLSSLLMEASTQNSRATSVSNNSGSSSGNNNTNAEKNLGKEFKRYFKNNRDGFEKYDHAFVGFFSKIKQSIESKDQKRNFLHFFERYEQTTQARIREAYKKCNSTIENNAKQNAIDVTFESEDKYCASLKEADISIDSNGNVLSNVTKADKGSRDFFSHLIEHELASVLSAVLNGKLKEKKSWVAVNSYVYTSRSYAAGGKKIIIKAEDFVNSCLKSEVFLNNLFSDISKTYDKILKGSESDKRLISKYKEKFGSKHLAKLVLYMHFFADDSKSLSLLLRENVEKEKTIIYESSETNIAKFFRPHLLKDKHFISLLKEFCKYFFGVDNIDKESLSPKAFGESIEEQFEDSLTDEERKNLKSFKARKACELLTTSVYRDLIEKSDKSGKPIRDGVYDFVSTGAVLGVGISALFAPAAIPYAVGSLLFTNELSGVARFVKNKINSNPEGLDNKVAQQFNKKIKQAGMEVDIAEEIQSVFDSYKEIIKDIDKLTESKSRFVHHTNSISSILRENEDTGASGDESDESAESKKIQFKIIDEEEVVQILEGNGVQLFSADFDSERVYSSFMSKFNGILRKYANIKIRNVKRRSVTKFLAHEQARSVTNQNAKVGQPACPILDIISRQMQSTGEEPVQALSSALNAINHSGGNMGMLLVLMMLTNPDGWGKLAGSFQGNKSDAIQQILELMSGTINNKQSAEELGESVDENAVSKVEITEDMLKRVFALIGYIRTKSRETKNVINEYDSYDTFKSSLNDKFKIVDELSNNKNYVYKRYLPLLLSIVKQTKRKEFDESKDIQQLVNDDYFMGTLIFQSAVYNIVGGNSDNFREFIIDADTRQGARVIELGKRHCLGYFYSNISNLDPIILDNKELSGGSKDGLIDIVRQSDMTINLNALDDYIREGVAKSYLRRLSLDIGFRDPVILNESEKDNIIDLRNEWRKLWNI